MYNALMEVEEERNGRWRKKEKKERGDRCKKKVWRCRKELPNIPHYIPILNQIYLHE